MPAIAHLFSRTLESFRPTARMDARAQQQRLYRELGAAAVADALLEFDGSVAPLKESVSANDAPTPVRKAFGVAA